MPSRIPTAARLGLASAWLTACSLGNYDYLSKEFAGQAQGGLSGSAGQASEGGSGEVPAGGAGDSAGAPAAERACGGLGEGEPCDDRDVCTRTSLCVAGLCTGDGESPCVVADSVRDFSMTQGLTEWSYGYWTAGIDSNGYQPTNDFALLVACPDRFWRVACVTAPDPAFRWTQMSADLAHGSTVPDLEMPVRRWKSDVSGLALASVDHHHADPGDGDGTRAILLLDGVSVWEHEIGGADAVGIQTSFPVTLEEGMLVELMLNPLASEARDMTHYSLVLEGR